VDLPRRLAAVWFADIVDYTRLSAQDEEAALGLVRDFQAVARDVVERQGGRVVKFLGDGALAEFPSTHAAVTAALALHDGLRTAGRAGGAVRVGVHVGEVSGAPDGDLYGDGVNVAARIQGEAGPGEVVVSDDAARQLRARRELALEPLGARELKGLPEPVRLFAVRHGEGRDGAAEGARAGEAAATRSVAVLPFANLSADPDNEYFSDGVTEEILTALARVDDLKVISRTSVMRFKATTRPVREIGRELGVGTLVEGSVRRAGSRVRITAQLIDARTDQHLWAEQYDRDLEDIFAIQTDVAERIVEALKVKLTPTERARITAAPTSLPAYQDYLRGLWFLNRRTPEDLRRAIEHFERAVESDREYAPAWAGMAGACALQLHWGEAAKPSPERAIAAADRAHSLDPGCGEACAARAMVRIYERDWAVAEHDFRCALKCNPSDANARQWYAHFLAAMGRFDEAYAEIARARELDPLSLVVLTEAGNLRVLARQYDEAIRLYRQARDLDPSFRPASYKLFELYETLGRHAKAFEEFDCGGIVDPADAAGIRESLARGSTDAYYDWLLRFATQGGWPLSYVAWIQSDAGDRDAAFATLDRAVAERDWYLVRLAVAPHWDPLRGDPRFRDLLARVGLDRVAVPEVST
jgi:adenylate cyclase